MFCELVKVSNPRFCPEAYEPSGALNLEASSKWRCGGREASGRDRGSGGTQTNLETPVFSIIYIHHYSIWKIVCDPMSVKDPIRPETMSVADSAAWRWQSTATIRDWVQSHDLHCGALVFLEEEKELGFRAGVLGGDKESTSTGEVLGEGVLTEKKALEENRSACLCHVPVDMLAHIFLQLMSFKDMALASAVCKKWRDGMREALAFRERLSFAGWRADDSTVGQLVEGALNLVELDVSLGKWGSRFTDAGLFRISKSKCCPNLTSISLWGVTGITDDGVVQLVANSRSLEHLNVGGTFITDASVLAIARHSTHLKVLNLWRCIHVTEAGVLALGISCSKLSSINVRGVNISRSCELKLLALNSRLHLKRSQE